MAVTWKKLAYAEDVVAIADIDDTPVDGETSAPISSNWAYEHAASIFSHDRFIDIKAATTVDGLTITGTSGYSVTANGGWWYMKTGSSSTYNAGLRDTWGYFNILATGKKTVIEFYIGNVDSVAGNDRYLYFASDMTFPIGDTANHFGFHINDTNIYANQGNGASGTEADTAVDLDAGNQFTILRAIYDQAAGEVRYYINGVLTNTISTNVPAAGSYGFNVYATSDSSTQKELKLGRMLLIREY
jgi:hypothetical protein